MFGKGDTVVHPDHGAVLIEDIYERQFQGQTRRYLKLRGIHGDLTASVPVDSATEVGLRQVASKGQLKKVMKVLQQEGAAMGGNWDRRFKSNLVKLHSGDIFQVAEVVRDLSIHDRDSNKGLANTEKRMVVEARQILVSELMCANEVDEQTTQQKLDKVLEDSHNARVAAAAR